MTVQRVSEQIVQCYSIEFSFRGFKWGEKHELTDLHWPSILSRPKETRNVGKVFPLRTPDFNLTEKGWSF
jgi:hypothetical protein